MKYYDDFLVGEKIITRARTVTEADIVNFASFTGDFHPMHVDVEFAKQHPFGERVAHGMLVLSLASGLWSPEYTMQWALIAFYGMDKVRFISPVKINETLHVELLCVSKEDKEDKSGVVNMEHSVINQRDEAVASCIIKLLIAKCITKS